MKLRDSLSLLALGVLLALSLTACGQKGGLTRPEQSALATTFTTDTAE